mgnify:CR=1 FL=1
MLAVLERRRRDPVVMPALRENNIIGVLENVISGRRRRFYGRNLVTNDGDQYYAEAITASGTILTVAGMNLGSSAVAPAKGDLNVGSIIANGSVAIDSGYPRANDADADNTGAGVKVVTWRSTFGTGIANASGIQEVAVCDTLGTGAGQNSVSRGTLASFTKTSSDTLKLFVNHSVNGI